MGKRARLFFIFYLVCAPLLFKLYARDYPVLHYSVEDGLPSTNVYSIYRDSKGFLWFGTDKGIARYNGIKFETFTTSDGLPDNEVFLFKEDYQGRLWMSTYNGEMCFFKDGHFHSAANTPFLKMSTKQSHIYNITVEKDSSVSFNFFDSQVMVNIKNEHKSVWYFPISKRSPEDDYIYYKRKIASNVVEIVGVYDISYLDTLGNVLSKKKRNGKGASIYIPVQDTGFFINIPSFRPVEFAGSDGYVYSGQFDTIASFKKIIFNNREVKAYYFDGINRFFLTNSGLVVNDSVRLLQGSLLSSMTQDVAGNYWISSLNAGVYCLKNNFLQTRIARNVWEGNIKYLKTSNKGVFFVPGNNSVYLLKDDSVSKVVDYPMLTKGEENLHREDAFFMDSTAAWYADFKVFKYIVANFETGERALVKYIIDTPRSGLSKVLQFGDKMYLFGRSDIRTFNFSQFSHRQLTSRFIFNLGMRRIYGTACSNKYGVMFSTLTNMYGLKDDTVFEVPALKNIILKTFIFSSDKLIGYTHTNQMLIIDLSEKVVRPDTIPAQNCVWDKLYVLDQTHILVSTSNFYRVITLHPNRKYSVLSVEDMFIPGQANAICVDEKNCYFFQDGNITVVPVSNLMQYTLPPRIYFTTIKTALHEYQVNVGFKNNKVEVPYDEAEDLVFSISRVVVSGQKIQLEYSISRQGEEIWRELKGESINLGNPGYGDFTVRIRAKTLSSRYCVPASIRLIVLRPYWATWWFVMAMISVVVIGVVLMVRYRIKRLVRKNEQEHQSEMKFVKSEYKALNALMNPHFVFNTLNNVQGLVNRDDKLAANEYIRVFADLIRQNMYNLSKEMITLQKEMELVVNYLLLEKLRFKELLNYSIEVDDNFDLSEIFVPPLLVQPLVENSIKHGILPLESVEGTVIIRIYEKDALLLIQVRDNGVGLVKARENKGDSAHESFAMENIKKRIDQLAIILNKQITLEMTEEKLPGEQRQWTVVTVTMPVF